ncbi:MAG: HAAAP family serine/threonine permease [Desulfarculales bacterium]|jgi:serine transporter|nr:HAAAP family serine/threonine permease [Desulfarculales bacterium]
MTSNNHASQAWSRHDFLWVLSLFGTAIGAGILFLPINAGVGGLWPLLIIAVICGPMTYYAHRGLSRFILSSSRPGSSITEVVDERFGKAAGMLITVLYFFSIYPIVLIYAVGITNTVQSFIVNQMGLASPPRALLSAVLIAAFMLCILSGEKIMLKVTEWIVYPLLLSLLFISIYLIPQWNLSIFREAHFIFTDVSLTLWMILPVVVFAFNHGPIISYFSMAQQRHYGDKAEKKASQILRGNAACMWVFVMFFVFSCVLSLTPEDMAQAKAQNISILSYLANMGDSAFIIYFAPLIAFTAITSSFFGHYLGAVEGLKGIVDKSLAARGKSISSKKINIIMSAFMFLTCWLAAIKNPSILGLIETISGPIIALILFVMPMCAVYIIADLRRYRGQWSNIFVLVIGTATVLSAFYAIFS